MLVRTVNINQSGGGDTGMEMGKFREKFRHNTVPTVISVVNAVHYSASYVFDICIK